MRVRKELLSQTVSISYKYFNLFFLAIAMNMYLVATLYFGRLL